MNPQSTVILFALSLMMCCVFPAVADDQTMPAEPSGTAADVLKEINGGSESESQTPTPEQTVQKMEAVAEGLAGVGGSGVVDDATIETQEEVLKDIDALIESLTSNRSSTQETDDSPEPETEMPDDSKPQQTPQSEADPMQTEQESTMDQPMTESDGSPGERRNSDAQSSEERNDIGTLMPDEIARRRDRLVRVWGHLPPSLKQKLLNISREKYLPEYEDRIRRYYRALDRD